MRVQYLCSDCTVHGNMLQLIACCLNYMHILADYINCAQHVEYRTFTDYFCETSHVLSPNLPLNTYIGFFGVVFVYKTHLHIQYQSKKMYRNYTTEQERYAKVCFNVVH